MSDCVIHDHVVEVLNRHRLVRKKTLLYRGQLMLTSAREQFAHRDIPVGAKLNPIPWYTGACNTEADLYENSLFDH